MNIAVDLRSLQSGSVSGVENYTRNILSSLLKQDSQNQYKLFLNRFFRGEEELLQDLSFVNSKIIKTKYPNKLLNLGLMTGNINLEKLLGDFNWIFLPNLAQYRVGPNAKVAITVHDISPVLVPEFYDTKRRLWHFLLNYKKSLTRANVIFAVSEWTKNDLVKYFGLPEEKIKVIYPGIDLKVFNHSLGTEKLRETRNRLSLPGSFLLFLNTIEPRKNLTNLLKAFEKLKSPETYLVIAGKAGWKYKKIFKEIRKSEKTHKIIYLGYVEEADKPALIKLARALVYPSFYEGFGFQPLEAMAMGTPSLSSQVSAIPEVCGRASLGINPYNIDEIRRGLETVLYSEPVRADLITEGFKTVQKYNWQTAASQILKSINGI